MTAEDFGGRPFAQAYADAYTPSSLTTIAKATVGACPDANCPDANLWGERVPNATSSVAGPPPVDDLVARPVAAHGQVILLTAVQSLGLIYPRELWVAWRYTRTKSPSYIWPTANGQPAQ